MAVGSSSPKQPADSGHDAQLALLDQADRAALLVDRNVVVKANETACHLLATMPAQVCGCAMEDLLSPLAPATLPYSGSMPAEPAPPDRIRCRLVSETSIIVELRTVPLQAGARWPQLWLLLVDRSQHMDADTRQAHRLKELISHLPSVFYRADNTRNWTMRFISDGCRSLTGYSEQQLLHDREISFLELIHPEDRGRVWHDIQQALRDGRSFRVSYRIRTAQGNEKWVWEQGVGVYGADSRVEAVEGFITDITARKRTEDTLSSSHQALARLLSNLPGMAYRCRNEPDWMFEFVSDGCVDLTGYLSAELVQSRRVAYGDLIVAEDRDRVWEEVQRDVRGRRPFASTYRILGADGTSKWVLDQGNGVFDGQGAIVAIEGFVCDVTDLMATPKSPPCD